jgi:hypothetical protein
MPLWHRQFPVTGPRLERETLKVPISEWVLAKYCMDYGITRLTAKDIKFILGTKYPYSTYYAIKMSIRDGLLTPVKKHSGLYDVNKEAMLRVLQQIPEAVGRNVRNKSPVSQWEEAREIAEAWVKLRDWALQHSSEGTSPPSAVASSGAGAGGAEPEEALLMTLPPGARKYFPIERIPTPSGQYAWVAVLGNRYVILEGIAKQGWGRAYCVSYDSFRPGAKLCSQRIDTLVKYTSSMTGAIWENWTEPEGGSDSTEGQVGEADPEADGIGEEATGGLSNAGSAGGGSASPGVSPAGPSGTGAGGGGPATGAGGLPPAGTYLVRAYVRQDGTVVLEGELPGVRGATYAPVMSTDPIPKLRRVDPVPLAPDARGISLVFDNVRVVASDGTVRQLHGLQPLSTVLAAGDSLAYTEPGFQVVDSVMYELSKVMDIHIYHSPGKDPRGTVRIEARPRAKALKKLGLARVLNLFVTFLHRLTGAFQSIVTAMTRLK